jgi:3D (Asp-Asp-Asp) domain-containing protein
MNTQLAIKIVTVITLSLLLQACNVSQNASLKEDKLGELISSIDDRKKQDQEGFDEEFAGNGKLLTLKVTSSAYNSLPGQTDSRPNEAAWGDILKPGMKAIAVSRDLLAMGLTRNTRVKIKGMPGTYRVLDKMNKRWSKKIDIYMGNDRRKAMRWGRRKVEISWYSN